MFVPCLVLKCRGNTGHSCVLLNLLFIKRSSCLCIGVICLFTFYALKYINMRTWCVMNSLESVWRSLCASSALYLVCTCAGFQQEAAGQVCYDIPQSWIANFIHRLALQGWMVSVWSVFIRASRFCCKCLILATIQLAVYITALINV